MPRIVIGLCVAFLMIAGSAAAVAGDPLVLVERIVDTRYGQTAGADSDFDRGLQSALRFAYEVKPGDTLQGIIESQFGLDPKKDTPDYTKLIGVIRRRNGLSEEAEIKPGQTLVMPDLPPQQRRAEGKGFEFQIPKVSFGPSRLDVLKGHAYDPAAGASALRRVIADLGDKSAPLVRQTRWVPASRVREDRSVLVIAQPIAIRFHAAANDTNSGPDDISHDIADLTQYAKAHPAVHDSVVYVLDDSWPDSASFADSARFLQQADAKIRETFYLGDGVWPARLTLPGAATDFPWSGSGNTSHAAEIETALAPFVPISPAVKVVYIPLFTAQRGASELLGEIIFVSLLARYKQDYLWAPLSPSAMQVLVSKAAKDRDEILDSLPVHQSRQPAQTDEAVVTGLLKFAQLYAIATGQPFFLNTSWVVNEYEFEFGPPANLLGATVAAVGDDPNVDIFEKNVLLASHARPHPGDVIAAMNNHPDGTRDNCTSYWTPPTNGPVYGLTYDGFIGKSLCGTSFSAPRIAWMLALRESRRAAITDRKAQYDWFENYRNFIVSLQHSSRAKDLKYWVSPLSVVNAP